MPIIVERWPRVALVGAAAPSEPAAPTADAEELGAAEVGSSAGSVATGGSGAMFVPTLPAPHLESSTPSDGRASATPAPGVASTGPAATPGAAATTTNSNEAAPAAAPPSEAAPPPNESCRSEQFEVDAVLRACEEGGTSAVKELMARAVRRARALGVVISCSSCHINQTDYARAPNAVAELRRWL